MPPMTSLLLTFIYLFSDPCFASDEILPEASFGEDGIVFEHTPSSFVMKTRFRLQTRATYEDFDSANTTDKDIVDFNIRRMRLRFDGTAFDSRFLYKIQLSFAPRDTDFENSEFPNFLRDAILGWAYSESGTLWFGQTKLPGNRQRVISSSSLEMVDRSLVNTLFTIDRDIGLQLHHRFGERRPLWIKLALSNGEGRGRTNENTGVSTTARVEWLPLGNFTKNGDYFEGDLVHEQDLKLSFGVVYNNNRNTNRIGGQTGPIFDGDQIRDMDTWIADVLVKHRGWAWNTEYAQHTTDNPFVIIDGSSAAVFKGLGYMTQLSYTFPNNWAPVLRYTRAEPVTAILSEENQTTQYTVGLTKYIDHHRIKILSDVTLEERNNTLTSLDQQNWIVRLQLEFGI